MSTHPLRNEYRIIRYDLTEPNLFEVHGDAFCMEDLYTLVGANQYVCTFYFRDGSASCGTYPHPLTGTVVYTRNQKQALDSSAPGESIDGSDVLKIRCFLPSMSQEAQDELKYGGVPIKDLEAITFMPFSRECKFNEDGTKQVPGILYVDLEGTQNVDVDRLFVSLVTMKNNAGTKLIPYEKQRMIGITLASRGGRIDSRLLTHFGYDVASVSACPEIAYYRLATKKRRKAITADEEQRLRELEAYRWMNRMCLLLKEVKDCGLIASEAQDDRARIATVVESLQGFEPHVLRNGKTQIYWDAEGYLHVALRHVREMQVGSFKSKTPFPYKADDLEVLVEQVLGQVSGEIDRHFEQPGPPRPFRRAGKMAAFFNGDYYCLNIDESGKLVSFYVTEPQVAGS